MFETREVTWSMIVDDFGASIDDLPFPTDRYISSNGWIIFIHLPLKFSLGNDSSSFENQKRLDQSGKLNNSLSLCKFLVLVYDEDSYALCHCSE
jgi:hypothetical protein